MLFYRCAELFLPAHLVLLSAKCLDLGFLNFSKLSFLQKSTTHQPATSNHLLQGFFTRCAQTKDINVNYRRQQLCSCSCGCEKVQWALCSVAFLYIDCYCICDLNGMWTAAMHQTLVPALPDCTGHKLPSNTRQVQDSTQAAEKNWDHSFPDNLQDPLGYWILLSHHRS